MVFRKRGAGERSFEVMSRSIAAPPPTSCTHPAEDANFHDLACKKGKKHGKKLGKKYAPEARG